MTSVVRGGIVIFFTTNKTNQHRARYIFEIARNLITVFQIAQMMTEHLCAIIVETYVEASARVTLKCDDDISIFE